MCEKSYICISKIEKNMNHNSEILKALKQKLIDSFGDNIAKVILFGSQVTGGATEFSDYDILIVLKCEYDWKFRNEIYDLCND